MKGHLTISLAKETFLFRIADIFTVPLFVCLFV